MAEGHETTDRMVFRVPVHPHSAPNFAVTTYNDCASGYNVISMDSRAFCQTITAAARAWTDDHFLARSRSRVLSSPAPPNSARAEFVGTRPDEDGPHQWCEDSYAL